MDYHSILDFIGSINDWIVYALIFLSALGEGLPLLGILSAGGILTIVGGFLAKGGALSLTGVLIAAIAGALIGDVIGYWAGEKYGISFLRKYGKYFFLKEEHRIEKTRQLISSHPAKAIIGGRFYYLTRSILPFLVGASNIRFRIFLVNASIGAIVWGSIHVLGGYIFGEGFKLISRYAGFGIIGATILAVIIFYSYRVLHVRHQFFKRYHVYTLTFNIVALYLFGKALDVAMSLSRFHNLDLKIQRNIKYLWDPKSVELMSGVTHLGGYVVSSLLLGALLIILFIKKRWQKGVLVVLSVLSAGLTGWFIKSATHLTRPPGALVATEFFSFPSLHTTAITLAGLLIGYCFMEDIKTKARKTFFVIFIAFVVLAVSFSRIYLNAHWTSDVVGGMALAVFWVTFYILLIRVITRYISNVKHS